MTPWACLQTSLALLAIDPTGLKGLTLRARVSPARDAALTLARAQFPGLAKVHPATALDDLQDGMDLARTLSTGTVIHKKGLLNRKSAFLLPMAERLSPQLTACLSQRLDSKQALFIALDEGATPDERLPPAIEDRLALQVNLDGLSIADLTAEPLCDIPEAQDSLARMSPCPDAIEDLVSLALQLGISGLRAPIFALRAARAHAALNGRPRIEAEDISTAMALVYASRATQLPQEPPPPAEPDAPSDTNPGAEETESSVPNELVLDAIKAALPPDLLAQLETRQTTRATGAGTGQQRSGNRRGRPLPARDRRAKRDERIDLIATLRAAVPWQTLRKRHHPDRKGAIILPEDLRAKRYLEQSDRLLIFTVDASGSAALARLGETKGAIELLLSEAYARRDHVALIAFRGTAADQLLPPTRSLVQTKRRLAELPGGGGTPTAAGLKSALDLAQKSEAKGLTTTIVLLTDGRSNIALDGSANRHQAEQDTQSIAQALRRAGLEAMVIDTGQRPSKPLAGLAQTLSAPYIPMPRADAKRLSSTISQRMER